MKLQGKSAIITGGTSGIGKGMASLFAKEGAKVVIAGRREDIGKKAEEELSVSGGKVFYIKADVTDESEVRNLMDSAVNRLGSLDILVNNAASGFTGTILDMTKSEWDHTIQGTLTSVFLCSKYAAPYFVKMNRGTILNIASGAGTNGIKGMAAYGTAKAGVINLTRCMAADLAQYQIRVNCISPGFIDTPAIDASLKEGVDIDLFKEKLAKRYPLGRIGVPADIANAALYLVSDDASFTTGTNLVVDGGVLCFS
ncbi:MAG: SDR family oxidoreductase [Syntrophales bacterium]|nr:SDR family oxidoreductase [Syntrophales bacterium]